jgi:hypothetical protein
MRLFILLVTCFISFSATCQSTLFPQSWIGNWKGELQWYKTGKTEPQKVNMELRIQTTDIPGTFTWQIIYGSATEDNRPYTLIAKDSTKTHWVIDENNGIVLDQYWIGNKFCGAFTVMDKTIVNNYWMENDKLMVEFYGIGAKPITTTGKGTEESPAVDSYKIGSYQKAILTK